MLRSRRLDIPGLLQHVIVRGIERRDIFLGGGEADLLQLPCGATRIKFSEGKENSKTTAKEAAATGRWGKI